MKEKTSRFWFIATVVLAAMYLTSNPTLTRRVGSQLSELWQGIISRVRVTKPPTGTISPEQQQLAVPRRPVEPNLEQQRQEIIDPQTEAAQRPTERVGADGKNDEKAAQESQAQGSTVPEVTMKDVLIQPQEKPPAGLSGSPAINEKDMPLEIVKEIYTLHLEALKILNSEVGSKKDEK